MMRLTARNVEDPPRAARTGMIEERLFHSFENELRVVATRPGVEERLGLPVEIGVSFDAGCPTRPATVASRGPR